MTADRLLDRLDAVREVGPGRWLARCPAHEDRNPSLSIRETENGRTLLHCFGGCEVDAVCGALRLRVADLFAPRPKLAPADRAVRSMTRAQRDLFRREALVIDIALSDAARGILSDLDRQRALLACTRLRVLAGLVR